MIYVLDTNVISELMHAEPNPVAFAWIAAQPRTVLYTTSLSHAEVLAGISIMPEGKRRSALAETAEVMFGEEFRGRILPFTADAANAYAQIFAHRRQMGRPIETADLIIAAIARAHHAAIVTRDVGGFSDCGLVVLDPWATT